LFAHKGCTLDRNFEGVAQKNGAAIPLRILKFKLAWWAQLLSYEFQILGKFIFLRGLQMIEKSLLDIFN
jgi:hypothetical protein